MCKLEKVKESLLELEAVAVGMEAWKRNLIHMRCDKQRLLVQKKGSLQNSKTEEGLRNLMEESMMLDIA